MLISGHNRFIINLAIKGTIRRGGVLKNNRMSRKQFLKILAGLTVVAGASGAKGIYNSVFIFSR